VEKLLNGHPPLTITPSERLILANQYAVLEALFPARRARYALQRRLLEAGVAAEYASLPPACNAPKACNRADRANRRRGAARGVNRGGALTPW
jgi:hypothetical protein